MDARSTEKTGDGKISASIKSPSGKKINNYVENNNDGTYKVTYILPEEGESIHFIWIKIFIVFFWLVVQVNIVLM